MFQDHTVGVVLLLAVIAAAAFFLSRWYQKKGEETQRQVGVRAKQVAVADVGAPMVQEGRRQEIRQGACMVPELLKSERLGLSGRPDYTVVDAAGFCWPVELKDRQARGGPRESDVVQVWVYCVLLEEMKFPTKGGEVRYRDQSFEIAYGPEARSRVTQILADMRRWEKKQSASVPQNRGLQCRNCKYRFNCSVERSAEAFGKRTDC